MSWTEIFGSLGFWVELDWENLWAMAGVLCLAGFLGMLLSFRVHPDRYQFNVLQAHVFLASAGTLFMLIIGGEIVTAVGLLGAASVVRYRYAIRNPRDAGTLIVALALGMACGSGAVGLALVATLFMAVISNLVTLLPDIIPFGLAAPRAEISLRIDTRNFDPHLPVIRKTLTDFGARAEIRSIDRKDRERKGTSTEIRLLVSYKADDFDFDEVTLALLTEDVWRIAWEEMNPFRE